MTMRLLIIKLCHYIIKVHYISDTYHEPEALGGVIETHVPALMNGSIAQSIGFEHVSESAVCSITEHYQNGSSRCLDHC